MRKKGEESLEVLMLRLLRNTPLLDGIIRIRVLEAFDKNAPYSAYVSRRDFKDGILFCSFKSSVVRDVVAEGKDALIRDINRDAGGNYLKDIVVR